MICVWTLNVSLGFFPAFLHEAILLKQKPYGR